MNVLITGLNGFAGRHLAAYLRRRHNMSVFGLDLNVSSRDKRPRLVDDAFLYECDIEDRERVRAVVQEVKPDRIHHLAARIFDPASRRSPEDFYATNIFGTVNLFEAVKGANINPLIHVACSSAEYGYVEPHENPIKESQSFRPISPYGVSKCAQDMLCYQYYMNDNLRIVRTRAFNITGPGEREEFVCSNFARQIARIERGLQEPVIHVGNLEAERDVSDVRDIVRGYCLALDKGKPGKVYNICSEKSYSIRKILDILLSYTNLKIAIEEDKTRQRPFDIPVQTGDCSTFKTLTKWTPEFSIERTLEDLLKDWRLRIKSNGGS